MNEKYKYDNATLIFLQDKFLAGDEVAKKYLWLASQRVASRIVAKEMRDKGLWFADDEIYDKAISSVEYVLRRYKKRAGYRIERNFVASIYGGVLHSMYYMTKAMKLEKRLVVLANARIKREVTDLNIFLEGET